MLHQWSKSICNGAFEYVQDWRGSDLIIYKAKQFAHW